jgi:RNA polymerase sigma-70 factor (ECF subfamily)
MKKKEEKVIFEEVYQEHKEYVYNTVKNYLYYKKEYADDVCQNIWILVYNKLHKYNSEKGTFIQWLYTITKHEIYKFSGSKENKKELYCFGKEDFNAYIENNLCDYSEAFNGEKESEQKQKIELIKNKSSKLKKGQKEIFRLYYFQGLKHDEIAEIKGLSSNTSKSQLMRAKAKIKQLIS